MTEGHRSALWSAAHLEYDDRDLTFPGLLERTCEVGRITDRFKEQTHDLCGFLFERPVEIVCRCRHPFAARGDRQVEAEPPVVVRERPEYRARLRDHRDRPAPHIQRGREGDHAQLLIEIVEAHAVAAAKRKPGLAGAHSDASREGTMLLAVDQATGEDGGGLGPVRDGVFKSCL